MASPAAARCARGVCVNASDLQPSSWLMTSQWQYQYQDNFFFFPNAEFLSIMSGEVISGELRVMEIFRSNYL